MNKSTTYIPSFGPLYAETDINQFPVEPWNTFSNVIFLLTVIYWWRKIHGRYREYQLISIALPLLFIGFVGGTIFHATRTNVIWLILDFGPIFALSLIVAYNFWRKLGFKGFISALFIFLPISISRGGTKLLGFPKNIFIPVGYATLAITLILPLILYCRSKKWKNFYLIILALFSFALALVFRTIDLELGAELLPMGTHFLWHIFGGVSTFLLFQYIYQSNEKSL